MKHHPYVGLPAHHYWGPSMATPAPGHIHPVVQAPLIRRDQTIVSLGSCFAQRLAWRIQAEGLPYLVTSSTITMGGLTGNLNDPISNGTLATGFPVGYSASGSIYMMKH